jgi:hypothetical protein
LSYQPSAQNAPHKAIKVSSDLYGAVSPIIPTYRKHLALYFAVGRPLGNIRRVEWIDCFDSPKTSARFCAVDRKEINGWRFEVDFRTTDPVEVAGKKLLYDWHGLARQPRRGLRACDEITNAGRHQRFGANNLGGHVDRRIYRIGDGNYGERRFSRRLFQTPNKCRMRIPERALSLLKEL